MYMIQHQTAVINIEKKYRSQYLQREGVAKSVDPYIIMVFVLISY